MRTILTTLATALLLLSVASPALAGDGTKIGVVDLQKALNDCEEGKRARSTLETRFERARQAIEKMRAEVEQLQSDLEAQRPMLSSSAIKEKEQELQTKMIEFQQMLYESQQQMALMEQELTGDILTKLYTVAGTIAAEGGFNLVIESSAVVYVNGTIDITDQVIARYNAK